MLQFCSSIYPVPLPCGVPREHLGLVEAVDGAADGAAHVALGSIGVVQEADLQGCSILTHVDGLDVGASGPVPHVEVASVAPWEGGTGDAARSASRADLLQVQVSLSPFSSPQRRPLVFALVALDIGKSHGKMRSIQQGPCRYDRAGKGREPLGVSWPEMELHLSSLQLSSNPMYSSTVAFMNCLGLNFWCSHLKGVHSGRVGSACCLPTGSRTGLKCGLLAASLSRGF